MPRLETLCEEGSRTGVARPALSGAQAATRSSVRLPSPKRSSAATRTRHARSLPPPSWACCGFSARGHGFVACEDGTEDVFVAQTELLGALHGDRVAVSVRRGERGFEGTIVGRTARVDLKYVAGLISQTDRGLVITPNDARLPQRVNVIGRVPATPCRASPWWPRSSAISKMAVHPRRTWCACSAVEGSAEVEVAKIKLARRYPRGVS